MPKSVSSVLGLSAEPALDRATLGDENVRPPAADLAKRSFDVGVVLLSLAVLIPLLATIIAIMLIAQGRPVIIRHKRVGRSGQLFPCYKFRTMVRSSDAVLRDHIAANPTAAAEWHATRKLKADPRVTPLGQVLRKLSIDELPQLLNVLLGDMSLVGPRPIVPEEVQHYGAQIRYYHSVRPGLTGSWQISGRNDVSYSRRVQLDTDYVSNWSFGRDLSILLKTVPAVVTSRGCY